ncbi:MAG: inositol monophosphatase family protein [Pseudomonadota bacterium]
MITLDHEHALIAAVRDTARRLIMPRFRHLDSGSVATKSRADDLVTIADQETEAALTQIIPNILPDALIVGEEATEADPDLPWRIDTAPQAVILDPVDGTWNFASGLANFGVILAVTQDGLPVFGLLYDPVFEDWVLARKGGGAWFCRDGMAPMRLQIDGETPEGSPGFAPFPLFSPGVQPRLVESLMALGRLENLRCSCHEYRQLARGHGRFVLTHSPKPWDHAAGSLICQEAGGVSKRLNGAAYRPGLKAGPLVSARNSEIFAMVQARLGWLTHEAEI